jgi:hypothetical protein
VSEDAVVVEIIPLTPQKVKRWAVNIVNPAAFHATNVMVRDRIAIESSLLAAKLQLLYYACPSQQIEIPIHGPQADLGQPATDNLIQTHRSGVRGEFSEFLQNHLALSGISL